MNDICRVLEQIEANGKERLALATIIRIEGSSYRKAGAKMLFWEDGQRYGNLSSGCLEDDLAIHSLEVIKKNRCKRVIYDLQDEDGLTWGVGCNGKIEVFIEPLFSNFAISTLKNYLLSGRNMVTLKSLMTESPQATYLFTYEGKQVKEGEKAIFHPYIKKTIQEFIHSFEKIKIVTIEGEDFLLEKNNPKTRLYVFGAGYDAEPLVKLASSLDFSVTVIDPRESRCNRDFFPTAEKLITEHPSAFFQHHTINEAAFVVIMNHHFQRDKQILEELPYERVDYIGILGSKKRTEKLLNTINGSQKQKIHYPIGLKIHAEGSDEISISIMAELIQFRHKKWNTVH
ncbi:hypothetical protein AN964_15580 [Heyndrickxia shackletonii]|uniref:Xanthine dehydrogenase n=1 Tax=Heyndrickxia shackletonii TaxID=157838 RepID=A0A0Q3WZ19_9BACI|nr:XdhC/CoxI family protein [Heyndrickxia shackletonii]KQL54788.1 hypothetical protein AN964_15580 [Heyndrickxia shackletonii]NEZ01800.1 XdhC family protein [Heyndrickxia shackletonii]